MANESKSTWMVCSQKDYFSFDPQTADCNEPYYVQFREFTEASMLLESDRDRIDFMESIYDYAAYGKISEKCSGTVKAMIALIAPIIDHYKQGDWEHAELLPMWNHEYAGEIE